MKLAHDLSHSEPANRLPMRENSAMETALSGYAFHPVRRASDTCPISRSPYEDERPPTSPKMHELRERMLANQASGFRPGHPTEHKPE